jgi:hypothetical protein
MVVRTVVGLDTPPRRRDGQHNDAQRPERDSGKSRFLPHQADATSRVPSGRVGGARQDYLIVASAYRHSRCPATPGVRIGSITALLRAGG